MATFIVYVFIGFFLCLSYAFQSRFPLQRASPSLITKRSPSSSLKMIENHSLFSFASILLSDTSVSEEEVLAVSGSVQELPSPLFAVGFAALIFMGIAALQFSLGDLNKQEGQARVRDFLQTRRDTERKRGYFD